MKQLLLILILCCSTDCFAQGPEKDGVITIRHNVEKTRDTMMYFGGNSFEWKRSNLTDTFYTENPVNGEKMYFITDSGLSPVTMNGQRIYSENELTPSNQYATIDLALETYIINRIIKDNTLTRFDWTMMRLNLVDLIIDENGRIVFYADNGGRARDRSDNGLRSINPFNTLLKKIIEEAPIMKSGMVNDKKVLVKLNINMANYRIEKKGTKITYTKDNKYYEF